MPNMPPLRDINDFLVYPAEFRILSLLRAEHRQVLKAAIAKNLRYYQVNYFFLALCLSALVLWTAVVFHVCAGSYRCTGAVFIVTCGTACYLYCKDSPTRLELRQKHYFALITACNFMLYVLLVFLVDYLYSALVVTVCATLAIFLVTLRFSSLYFTCSEPIKLREIYKRILTFERASDSNSLTTANISSPEKGTTTEIDS